MLDTKNPLQNTSSNLTLHQYKQILINISQSIYILPLIMKNPFDNLPASDEEDNSKFVQVDKKKDAAQKKPSVQQPKTSVPAKETRDNRTNVNDNLIANQRENTKGYKSDKEQRPYKEITDHRVHDRKSGTGRVSEPRKNAGGRGGIGNMKDQLNQDKILAKVNEEGETEEQVKEPEPEALTLEEYYARQGLNIDELDKKKQQKVDGKKEAPKSEWVTKQKLEFVKTKQDNILQGESKRVAVLRDQSHKIETAPEQQLLGFTSTAPKKREGTERPSQENKDRETRDNRKGGKPRENKDNRNNEGGNRKYEQKRQPQQKLVINEQDFPSL